MVELKTLLAGSCIRPWKTSFLPRSFQTGLYSLPIIPKRSLISGDICELVLEFSEIVDPLEVKECRNMMQNMKEDTLKVAIKSPSQAEGFMRTLKSGNFLFRTK